MSAALSGPFLAVAGVLCVSGLAKLRAPRAAVPALALLGLPAARWLVAAVAVGEITLGLAALLVPVRGVALLVGLAYVAFAVVAARLAALRASCGCFGESQAAASPVQSLLSAGLAGVAIAAAVSPPAGAAWVLGRPAGTGLILGVGIAGCIYGLVIAYTQLPSAWGAWSAR